MFSRVKITHFSILLFLTIVLAGVILFSCVPVLPYSPDPPDPTVTPSPSPGPTRDPAIDPREAPGDGWLIPPAVSPSPGDDFSIELHVNTGTSSLGAFGITATWDSSIATIKSGGGSFTAASGTGLNLVANTNEPGIAKITGFTTEIITAGADVMVGSLNFNATIAGTLNIGLVMDTLAGSDSLIIGVPYGYNGSVIIQ